MTEQTPGQRPSTTDQILDLLLDALAERQRARQATPSLRPSPTAEREVPPPRPEPPSSANRHPPSAIGHPPSADRHLPSATGHPLSAISQPGEEGWQPPAKLPSINMGKLLGRLAILVAILVVVINIPVKSHGVSLARILPDTASLIIRDGLVLKGSGPEIYRLEDNKLRWISSMDAFEYWGLAWKDVHVVDDKFLAQFEKGHPIHLLLKCESSPHIYALENGQKRWIKDIQTFTAEGYEWVDVSFVSCDYLRNLPDGQSIPEDAGPPPQP